MAEYTSSSHPIKSCQICGTGSLEPKLFVGYIPPVNTMPEVGSIPQEQPAFPLELVRCSSCGHVQIGLEVDAEVLFPYSYPYLSGTTRILRENFANLYQETCTIMELGADDLIIDIGSNDGSLLINFFEGGHRVLGVEPSKAGEVARERGVDTLTAYFGLETAKKVLAENGKAKVMTAANVFAHITNPHNVVEAIIELLDDNGIFISESHYLGDLLETVQYDTIYHEHLRYYHLGSLITLFEQHGLEVFKVTRIPTHGGSIRVYTARKGQREIDASVTELLAEEEAKGVLNGTALDNFRERVIQSKLDLHALFAPIKKAGGKIYGIGAPSRASTLINYVGLDDGLLNCVVEVSSSHKLNKYIPGTRIPVLDEQVLFDDQPEYALLLSWHIADDLMAILKKNGFKGKFIVPLPKPYVVD
jgi:SAM-dependent methyltransferase